MERAQEFSWERVTAKVDDYYGFVIRRLAATGSLPPDFHAEVPPSPRAVARACRSELGAAAAWPPVGLGRAAVAPSPPRPAALRLARRRGNRAVARAGGRPDPPDPRRVADDEARDRERDEQDRRFQREELEARARPGSVFTGNWNG